jgi:hypothetical protein
MNAKEVLTFSAAAAMLLLLLLTVSLLTAWLVMKVRFPLPWH